MSALLTGSQTVGPYFAIGLSDLCSSDVASDSLSDKVVVEGQLLDCNGVPIPDGFIEVWQANANGQYATGGPANAAHEANGFARISTSPAGSFRFTTIKPGPVPYDSFRMQAPHLLILVYMRGLLRNLVTRLYFPDDPANSSDPILQLVPVDRRSTLIAQAGSGPGILHWDIVMRDQESTTKKETVFFAW